MGKLFGTDGIRGVANVQLTPELAFDLGRSAAYVLTKSSANLPKIIMGMDTRISCDMLAAALTAGICSVGATVYNAGVLPTPAIAYLTRKYGLDAGVVISASHNPFQDNGIKLFSGSGYKLPDALEDEIEQYMFEKSDELPRPTGDKVGRMEQPSAAIDDYVGFLADAIDNINLSDMKIALDCANGATFEAAPKVFKKLGAEVLLMGAKPDGLNINRDCGSTHVDAFAKFMKEHGADVGFAFDGDGDRCFAVDESGKVVEGDEIMTILGHQMKKAGKLTHNTIVATVMSNLGLSLMGKEHDITIERTAVGDRYVLERMIEGGFKLGGEQSGHIILLDHNPTGDGILTALKICSIIRSENKTLSQLNNLMTILPQVLINAKVAPEKKNNYLTDETIIAEIKRIEAKFENEGRVLIRPSGTEPLVRVMIEGKDQEVIEAEARALADMIERVFN